jgi:hypothetical protein
MNASNALAAAPEYSLETFAADLTDAVFPVALRYGVGDRWLDLELDLWRALSETVEKCARASRGVSSPDEFAVCRKGLLAELVNAAYHTTLRHGARESILEAREGMDQAFRWAIREKVRGCRRAQA